jgi:DNA (cytosine-5)-methyltransferase 1
MAKSVELFSGCGGLAKGLEHAGFEHCALVEWNKWACQSLRLNFPPERVYETDIRSFDFKQFGEVDLVAGGPPCQPFSLGGLAKAFNDSRDMFPQAARAIGELQPRAFVFENVKGLLRESFRQYFTYILLRLTFPCEKLSHRETWQEHLARLERIDTKRYAGLRYRVSYKLLNAADYGVPQVRERVFIVGLRSDLNAMWTWPSPTTDKYAWRTIADTLHGLPPPLRKHGIPDHVFIDGARTYYGHTGSDINQPSKTIKAGAHGVPGGENMLRFPDGNLRYMTVHEAKLIQTFPPDFKICGSWGEAMRQIGNAVPVKLAEIIGKQLIQTLETQSVGDEPLLCGTPKQLVLFESPTLYLVHKKPVTLLGTYRKDCRNWIVANNLYNYPVSDADLDNSQPLRTVRRLVLKRAKDAPLYFSVIGYSVVGKKDLALLGYKTSKAHPAKQKYILYKLSPLSKPPSYDVASARPILGRGITV